MSTPFELPAEMTIYSAVEIRDALLTWVTEEGAKTTKALEVSAEKVSEIDGAGLQLLAALSNTDQHWRLVKPSRVLVEACQTIGLAAWLDKVQANA